VAAAGGSLASAAWALAELQNPSTPGHTPQASPNISPRRTPSRSSSPAAARPGSSVMPRPGSPGHVAHGPVRQPAHSRGAHRGQSPGLVRSGHDQSHVHRQVSSAQALNRDPGEEGEQQDAYHAFRQEALQLTRRWHKAAQRAAASYSGYSGLSLIAFQQIECIHDTNKALMSSIGCGSASAYQGFADARQNC
jgi:hypothetical protein